MNILYHISAKNSMLYMAFYRKRVNRYYELDISSELQYNLTMKNSYRILSLEAADIYKHEQENGVDIGYKMPEYKSYAYFRLFKNILDYSLDTIELEKVYPRICRKKLAFQDKYENNYALAVVSVKFNYTYKSEEGNSTKVKELRKYFYENGFSIDGVHYVRYKRSAGSSREGTCLFIDARIYKAMTKWSDCGLKPTSDLASWESYRALSLSSIKGTIDILLNGILFVPDYKNTFTDEVVSVELQDGKLVAEQKKTQITNDIWDGESLLDESLFAGIYADKHFLLLRNKFFKTCAFKTKLQKWIKDKNITLDDLRSRGFITLASDINQIVMVTTPNSLKYLKFMAGFTESNIRKWTDNVDSIFGVVKWDKRTRYFGGRMVQSSYQLLNSVFLTERECEKLLTPSIEYIKTIRSDVDFMRYHFANAYAREKDADDQETDNELVDRADIILSMLKHNFEFENTKLYINFRNEVVKNLKHKLKRGKLLLNGTNATLFGNGAELLKYIAGEEITSELKQGQIRLARFPHKAKLLCARSPHITMGNLYLVENNLDGDIWDYFDLGDNIVCVNAINENIQQRLNGCDYDSDSMLITNNAILIDAAAEFYNEFKVPVCNIQAVTKANQPLYELDYNTSVNKVGEIVNLSQKLNTLLWDMVIKGYLDDKTDEIYFDVCKLAVLSGIEIDKAKRAYDNINVTKELSAIRNKYEKINPDFFKEIDFAPEDNAKEYEKFYTTMDHIYGIADKIKFNAGRNHKTHYTSVTGIADELITSGNSTDYRHRDKVIEICEEYKTKLNALYDLYSKAEKSERAVLYETIAQTKAERDELVAKQINSYAVLVLLIRLYEQKDSTNWHVYEPIVKHLLYREMLSDSGYTMPEVVEDENGEYSLYDLKFTKKP